MPQLSETFPFPSRRSMLVNGFLYVTFAILVPVEVGSEMFYASPTNWKGLALWVAAIVNGALAILWLRWFDKVRDDRSR
jgi:hypothetical protein